MCYLYCIYYYFFYLTLLKYDLYMFLNIKDKLIIMIPQKYENHSLYIIYCFAHFRRLWLQIK